MENNLYSDSLKKFEGEIINTDLLNSLTNLKDFLGVNDIPLLDWDDNKIAIPIPLKINLPPHGNFDNIDIRKDENIILTLNIKSYPEVSPVVFTDRIDFPKDNLAHLYIAKNERPPAFCLVKGNQNDWYASKRISDIIIRTQNWLRDAASGELAGNANEFDPLRLEGYRGTIIYKYDELADIVKENLSYLKNSNFAMALFEDTSSSTIPTFKIVEIITKENFNQNLKLYYERNLKYFEQLEKKTFKYNKYTFGYILWSRKDNNFDNYSITLPSNWKEFCKYCLSYSITPNSLQNFLIKEDKNFWPKIPIIIGIKRPLQIVGYSQNIEFVNFYINFNSKKDITKGRIKNEVFVNFQAHREPLSILQAQNISGGGINIENPVIFGCGALGSKIAMHFIRNGMINLTLVDNDELSPHNIARHSLLAEHEGMNKALALAKVILNTYRYDKINEIIGVPKEGTLFIDSLQSEIDKKVSLFDFTASENFATYLVKKIKTTDVKICKASMVNNGNIGILFFEGENRNPRIDDLQIILYSKYNELEYISEWLQNEYNPKNKQSMINVGVGCNSETTILSDEIITIHSAYFFSVIKQQPKSDKNNRNGNIYLSRIINNMEFNIKTEKIDVVPVIIYDAINDNSWQIRLFKKVITTISDLNNQNAPNETGGIFIGAANYKTKTIHVVDIVNASEDSEANSVHFTRGINNLSETIKEINIKSGNQLGYIGEWHTHPMGLNKLSHTDMKAVEKLRLLNNEIPIPTFIAVFSNNELYPYVYN